MDLIRALHILGKKKKVPEQPKQKQYVNTPVVTCPYCDYEHPEAPPQSMAIGCGNCGKPFAVELIRTATGKRVREEKQTLDHDEVLKTYITRPVRILEKKPVPDIKTLDEAVEMINAQMLDDKEFKELVALHPEWRIWEQAHERSPFYPEGDNRSRESGAIYHPRQHPKGIIYQIFVKGAIKNFIFMGYGAARALYGKDKEGRFKRWILRRLLTILPGMIEYANRTMQKDYDKDAFVFEDPFLLALRDLATEHVDKNFQWDEGTIAPMLLKGVDMALAHLKEDLPYRAKAKLFINDLIVRYPNGFELTFAEKEIQRISNEVAEKCKREGGPCRFNITVPK